MRGGLEQRDRSLTVMIPRAKYRHVSAQQSPPSVLTMSTFSPEQKAVSYMDCRQTPTKVNANAVVAFSGRASADTTLGKATDITLRNLRGVSDVGRGIDFNPVKTFKYAWNPKDSIV